MHTGLQDLEGLRDLYQEVIFDHNRRPRNYGEPSRWSRRALGHNPLCGDRLTLYLDLAADGTIRDLAFQGQGCAISTASASLMTEALKGRTAAEAEGLFQAFHTLVAGGEGAPGPALGKLAVLAGVREYPSRVKCATLAWHTLHAALGGQDEAVSTEDD